MSEIEARAFELWEHEGIRCAMVVAPLGWHVNGYAQLPRTHPDHGKDYSDFESVYDVHGGLTYGSDMAGWIGFDTMHAWDEWPADELLPLLPEGSEERRGFEQKNRIDAELGQRYGTFSKRAWTVALVRGEVNRLAEQVANWLRLAAELRESAD